MCRASLLHKQHKRPNCVRTTAPNKTLGRDGVREHSRQKNGWCRVMNAHCGPINQPTPSSLAAQRTDHRGRRGPSDGLLSGGHRRRACAGPCAGCLRTGGTGACEPRRVRRSEATQHPSAVRGCGGSCPHGAAAVPTASRYPQRGEACCHPRAATQAGMRPRWCAQGRAGERSRRRRWKYSRV